MNNFIQNHKYLHNLSTLRQYNKNKFIKYFFFTLNDFTYSNFEKKIINFISTNKTYTLYVLLSFSHGTEFRIAGRQIGMNISKKINNILRFAAFNPFFIS